MPDDPRNSLLPSANVTSLPFAFCDPSLARKPATKISVPASKDSFVNPLLNRLVGGTPFNHPAFLCAVRLRHVDVDPRMRIHPFHPDDRTVQLDWACRVEFRRECVMRANRGDGYNHEYTDADTHE